MVGENFVEMDSDGGAGQTDTNPSNDARKETTILVAKTERPGGMGVYTLLVDRTRRRT